MFWIVFFAILGAFVVWLLCSMLYKPIGTFWHRIFKDAVETMNEKENKKE